MTRNEYEKLIDKKLLDFQANNLDKYDNELIKLAKQLKQELMAEYKKEPSIDGWKVGDKYYRRAGNGDIYTYTIECDKDGKIYEYDVFNITHGYAKHTAEEVQFQIERDAVLYELSKFAEPKDREWNKYRHYYITWNYESNTGFYIDWRCYRKHNDIYFESEEDAKKAIEAVGEKRIKKYYLGVED